jgi:hypothetical protein
VASRPLESVSRPNLKANAVPGTKRKSQAKPRHLHRYRRGDRGDHTARDATICARRKEGATLAQIGKEHGLSGTAVGYVLAKQERKAAQYKHLSPLRAVFARGLKG